MVTVETTSVFCAYISLPSHSITNYLKFLECKFQYAVYAGTSLQVSFRLAVYVRGIITLSHIQEVDVIDTGRV